MRGDGLSTTDLRTLEALDRFGGVSVAEALERYRAALRRLHERGENAVVALPPGSGKTLQAVSECVSGGQAAARHGC